MHTILLVGTDETLLRTRAAILSKTGSDVVWSNASSALAIQAARECDLVVFCHSLWPETSASLAQAIRKRWPQTRILQVVSHRLWEAAEVSTAVDATSASDPQRLLDRATELLRRVPFHVSEIAVRGGVVRSGPFAR